MAVVMTQGPFAPAEQYANVVDRLRRTFASGRTRGYAWRREQLEGLSCLLDQHQQEVIDALGADLGRGPIESVMFDVSPTKSELQHAIKQLRRWMRPNRVHAPATLQPARAWYSYEPLGVTLVIAPWNYPIHLSLTPLVSALAAGNCVVIKPSEITPASSRLLAELLPRYVDPEAVAVVEGGPEATLGLLDQGLDHCFFTGSPAVGSAVMAAAAPHLTPVTLELGGKCPVIVTSSAHLEVAARRVAFGKLANSGQTCVAPDYVLVEASVRDQFVDLLTTTLTEFSQGRDVPVVNTRHATRLAGLLSGAGGRTMLGGTIDTAAARVQPTVILDPSPDSAILHEEVFGPLLPIVTVDSLSDAIAHVQRGSRPLASYVFTQNRDDERRVLEGITTGGTVVNHVMLHLGVKDLPFGGVGSSGMGHYHGRWGFEAFSYPKAVLRKPTRPDMKMIYPPYKGFAMKMMMRGLRTPDND